MSRVRVIVDGVTYDTDDMTLDETIAFERETGSSWLSLNPWQSARQCKAILTTFYARTRSHADAEKIVGALTTKSAADHLVLADEEDDRPIEHRDGIPVVDPKAGSVAAATT